MAIYPYRHKQTGEKRDVIQSINEPMLAPDGLPPELSEWERDYSDYTPSIGSVPGAGGSPPRIGPRSNH